MNETKEFFTKNKSVYKLDDNDNLFKGDCSVGKGFYVPAYFLNKYIFELEDGCFKDEEQKQNFIVAALVNDYKKLKGLIVFFNKDNPLKLELSSNVVRVEPRFSLEYKVESR